MIFSATVCRVPHDVIEVIVQELANDKDMASLKACSLVCREFVGICRRHIFFHIRLADSSTYRARAPPVRRLKKLLDRNPSIAGYVRSLDYVSRFNPKRSPPVLMHLNRVRSFKFGFTDHNPYGSDRQDWGRIPSPLRSSFYSFIQSNNIVNLRLYSISRLPITIFMHFPCLTALALGNISVLDSPHTPSFHTPETSMKLVDLCVLGNCLGALQDLLAVRNSTMRPLLDLAVLEEFSIVVRKVGMDAVGRMIAPSEKLRSLSVSGLSPDINCRGHIAQNLSVGSLRTLKKIRLSPMLEGVQDDPYVHLTEELKDIAGKNVLEELILDIGIDTDEMCTTEASRWSELDRVLSQPSAFPFLRRVEMSITTYQCSRDYTELHDKLEDIGRDLFPGLRSIKSVEFSFEIRDELI
ncbi:hypothetical protein BDZ97DRAFT_1330660 [Flammula alnicola]|nr:hypothetical protein BDZ97DRAFT_1330660 [Flammula alnicola]